MNSREQNQVRAALRYWDMMEMSRLVQEEGPEAEDAAGLFRADFETEAPLNGEEIESLINRLYSYSGPPGSDDRFSDYGCEISGGYISYPDDDGTIRHVDDDGNTMEVRRPGDDGYDEWWSLFDIDMEDFNRRWELKRRAWNRNIEDQEILGDRFNSEQKLVEASEKALFQELDRSNQSWRICDRTIIFQHPRDNYEADKKGKQRFPYAAWDSESGQGFVYCNEQFEGEVMDWLEEIGCEKIDNRDNPSKVYVSDPSIVHPRLP